jgi:uncharacterized membrane protein
MTDVLYCGDTSLDGAAAYLAGLMTTWGWSFDYVASDQPCEIVHGKNHQLYIFSDYPASLITSDQQDIILKNIANGAGFLMIGGWESYHGLGGDWEKAHLAAALPVEISSADDRINSDSPVMVQLHDAAHQISQALPWNERPPLIGGYNRVTARHGSRTVLEALRFNVRVQDGLFRFQSTTIDPLLVTGNHESGRTAALTTDVAPHWVGPLVDWGDQRVTAQAPGAWQIEVGDLYAQFLKQLLSWTGRFD